MMTDRLPDRHPTDGRRKSDPLLAALAALVPGGILVWHLGWPPDWPAALLPVSVAGFTFVWTFGLQRLLGRPLALILGLIVGAGAAHLMLWLPFLLISYAGGQGTGRLVYSAFAGLVTAAAVAWYVLGEFLWQTVLFIFGLGGVLYLLRLRRAGGKA